MKHLNDNFLSKSEKKNLLIQKSYKLRLLEKWCFLDSYDSVYFVSNNKNNHDEQY